MPNTKSNFVKELLESLKDEEKNYLIKLQCKSAINDLLMKNVLKKVKNRFGNQLEVLKISEPLASEIKTELKLIKFPSLILVRQGKIIGLFEGIISHHQLIDAIENCNKI